MMSALRGGMKRWFAFVVLLLGVSLNHGVIGAEDDTQQWSSVTLEHALTPDVTANFTTRLRFDEDISHAKDLLVRPWVSIKATDGLSLGLGYDHIEPFPSSANSEDRVWQQLGFKHSIFDLPVSGHIRLEERFLEDVGTTIFRSHWRLELEIPIPDEDWYFTSFNEVFMNHNSDSNGPESGFEQNRLFFGFGGKLSEHVKAEFGYQWVYERKRRENENIHALILNLKIQTGDGNKR
jgi:hypothetical protein